MKMVYTTRFYTVTIKRVSTTHRGTELWLSTDDSAFCATWELPPTWKVEDWPVGKRFDIEMTPAQ